MDLQPPEIKRIARTPTYLLRMALPFAWVAVMSWLSLTSSPPQISGFWGWDKLQHAGAYGLLTLLLAQLIYIYIRSPWKPGVYAAIISIVYGGILEIVQLAMQSGRYAEWADLAADACGAATGCVIFRQAVLLVCRDRKGRCTDG